jgi:hypothetical protein
MALLDHMKLQKLKIHAYQESTRRPGEFAGTFEAMFNPTSISQKYAISYGKMQSLATTGISANYVGSKPRELKLKLILDGTGVHEMGISQLSKRETVSERVKKFLDVTFRMEGEIHKPLYLTVEWGDMDWGEQTKGQLFLCLLASVEIAYTSFNRDGSPLRAELDVTLISDIEADRRVREEKKTSPDLTHHRIVKSGDTLPLLCKEIYGSPIHYLRVAQANNLDDFRNLSPGQELFFPPLER